MSFHLFQSPHSDEGNVVPGRTGSQYYHHVLPYGVKDVLLQYILISQILLQLMKIVLASIQQQSAMQSNTFLLNVGYLLKEDTDNLVYFDS